MLCWLCHWALVQHTHPRHLASKSLASFTSRVTYWRWHRLDNFPHNTLCVSHPPCVTSVENSLTKHDLHWIPTTPASHLHPESPTIIRNPFRWSAFQGTTYVSPLSGRRDQRLIQAVCDRCAEYRHTNHTQYVW